MSVVIPAFNCGEWICDALDSVLQQTRAPRQIIVVDDGSVDDTAKRVSAYGERVEYVHQSNAGVSAARNRAVDRAREPFVSFLDGDDVWHPRKLELQLDTFRHDPELGLLSTPQYRWPAPRHPDLDVDGSRLPIERVTWEQVVIKNRLHTSSVIVRHELLRRAGPFDVALHGPEDRDMWLRLLRLSPGASLKIALSGYRIRPGGISQDADRCRDGMRRILQKVDKGAGWSGRRLLRRKAYCYMNHSCAYLYSAAGRQGKALSCSLRSFAWYPFSLRDDLDEPGERLRRAAVIGMRLLRLRPRERRPPTAPPDARAGFPLVGTG